MESRTGPGGSPNLNSSCSYRGGLLACCACYSCAVRRLAPHQRFHISCIPKNALSVSSVVCRPHSQSFPFSVVPILNRVRFPHEVLRFSVAPRSHLSDYPVRRSYSGNRSLRFSALPPLHGRIRCINLSSSEVPSLHLCRYRTP